MIAGVGKQLKATEALSKFFICTPGVSWRDVRPSARLYFAFSRWPRVRTGTSVEDLTPGADSYYGYALTVWRDVFYAEEKRTYRWHEPTGAGLGLNFPRQEYEKATEDDLRRYVHDTVPQNRLKEAMFVWSV